MLATNHQPTDLTKSPQLLCEQQVFITSADELRGYLGRYFGFLVQKASPLLPPSPAPPRPAPVPGGQCDQQTNRKLGRQQACENVPQAWRSHAVLSNNATCISGLIIFLVNPLDAQNRVQDTFWAQPAKTRPFTTSTGFLLISPVANLLPSIWTGQYPIIFFQVPTNYFFIVTTSGQELGYWYVSRFSNVARLWNAIMKQKLCMFIVHQTAISLQCTKHLNPRTRWYPALHEPNRIKPAYVTSHPGKNPPPQSSYRLEIRLAS